MIEVRRVDHDVACSARSEHCKGAAVITIACASLDGDSAQHLCAHHAEAVLAGVCLILNYTIPKKRRT